MSELVEQLGEHLVAPPRDRAPARTATMTPMTPPPGRDDDPDRLYTLTGGRSRSGSGARSTW